MISITKMKRISDLLKIHTPEVIARNETKKTGKYVSAKSIADYGIRYKKFRKDMPKDLKSFPKVLLFDLETSPMENQTWHLYPKYIHIGQILRDWSMISWSAKWLFGDHIVSGTVTPKEAVMKNDEFITRKLWKMIDDADVIIAHNLRKFDRKKMNTVFLKYGLGMPSPYQLIDTLTIARFNFAISSNKLDYLAEFLKIPKKLDTGFSLWRESEGVDAILSDYIQEMDGGLLRMIRYDKKIIQDALDRMTEYCNNDVEVLEAVYLRIRSWDKRHPNLSLYGHVGVEKECHICKSTDLIEVDEKRAHTNVSLYPLYRCASCGAWNRGRFAEKRSKNTLVCAQ
jgi:hypothetical protein